MTRCCCEMESKIDDLESELADALAMIKQAVGFIRGGQTQDAMHRLLSVCGDEEAERVRKKEAELSDLLDDWRKQPAPRPDFLTFAHKRRKWSAT